MRKFRFALGAGLAAVLLAGCTSASDDAKDRSVSFVSFNAMLAEHGQNVEERLGAIAESLMELEPEVVCLQEIWQLADVERLASKVKKALPNAHYTVKGVTGTEGCKTSEVDQLTSCFNEFCASVATEQMAMCATLRCAGVFSTVSKACQDCVLRNGSLGDIASIANTCLAQNETTVYEKQNGLLLLSKLPMSKEAELALPSTVLDRGVLYAEITSDELSQMGVFCTHLAVNIPDDTASTKQGEEPTERQAQIDAMLDYVDEKKSDHRLAVVMGDMNCGPGAEDVKAADPEDFQRLTSRGLSASYANDSAFCTWCTDNELVPEGDNNNLIDHILFTGLSKRDKTSATRVLDARVDIKVDGKAIKSQLSDHYGLEVRVSRP